MSQKKTALDKPPSAADKQSRSGWMFISAAVLMLVALFLWMQRLQEQVPEDQSQDQPTKSAAKLVADGSLKPGEPVAIPFGQERCVPWNVSAAEDPPSAAARYLILTSQVVDPYGYTLAGFGQECGEQHPIMVLEKLKPGELAQAVTKTPPSAIVAVGRSALELAQREAPDLPLLYSMVRDPAGMGLDESSAVGVVPWVPMAPLVRHLVRVLPRKKTKWAILYSPGRMSLLAQQATSAAKAAGRTVNTIEINSEDGLEKKLAQAAETAQVWLVLPDRQTIDHRLFNKIQIAAENKKIPLCVTDEEHVRAGAYAGAGADSHRVGRQLCHLAGALERSGLPEGNRVFCPEYSFAVIHTAVIEKLGYILDPLQLEQSKIYKWH